MEARPPHTKKSNCASVAFLASRWIRLMCEVDVCQKTLIKQPFIHRRSWSRLFCGMFLTAADEYVIVMRFHSCAPSRGWGGHLSRARGADVFTPTR